MESVVFSRFLHPNAGVRRELVGLLYTSLPQVMAISVTSVIGAMALAAIGRDTGYAGISCFILITAAARVYSLYLYRSLAAGFSDDDVVKWERIYGVAAAAFSVALGLL